MGRPPSHPTRHRRAGRRPWSIRREEGKSVSVTELMREAIDEWLAKRRAKAVPELRPSY